MSWSYWSLLRGSQTIRRSHKDRRDRDRIELHGQYPAPAVQLGPVVPTFLSAAVAYMQAGGRRKYVVALIRHFGKTPLTDFFEGKASEQFESIWQYLRTVSRP